MPQQDSDTTRCSTTSQDTPAPSVASGLAIIEGIGWQDREETPEHAGGRAFIATLRFDNGPPDLPSLVVWQKIPVKLLVPQPEPASLSDTSNTDPSPQTTTPSVPQSAES